MCHCTKISWHCVLWEIKGSENFFRLVLSKRNWIPIKTINQLSIRDAKMLLLTRKIGKAFGIHNFVICMISKIPTTFSNLEPVTQPKLTHAYDVFPIWRLWPRESDCCRIFREGTWLRANWPRGEWSGGGRTPLSSPLPYPLSTFSPLSPHPIFKKRAWSQAMACLVEFGCLERSVGAGTGGGGYSLMWQ